MSRPVSIILIVSLLLALLAGYGSYTYYKEHTRKQIALELQKAEEEAKIRQAIIEDRKKRYARFEALLNGLIRDISEQAREYKIRRSVLKESLSPHNFSTPEYAAQTYKAYIEIMAPSLREQSDNLMAVFDDYQNRALETLKDVPEEKKAVFMEEWNKMIKDKIERFILFFQHEEKIIQAHKNLLEFYYKNAKTYTYQEETGSIIFLSEQAKAREAELVLEVRDLLSQKP